MIAGHVVPGNAHLRDDAVIAREHGQVIEENIAHGHAEGCIGSDQLGDHAVADIVKLLLGLWLRIRKEDCLEIRRLVMVMKGKVDALG